MSWKPFLLTFKTFIFLALLATVSSAEEEPKRPALAVAAGTAKPKIDGILSPGEWPTASQTLAYQISPGNNATPSASTQFWITMDADNLYFAAKAFDDRPELVRGRIRPRDELDDEDTISVILDSFFDKRRAYLFQVNPRGVQADGVVTEGEDEDFSWDGIFQSAGQVTTDGYVVELAIPWKTLRFRPQTPMVWGMHVQRVIPRKNEEISWAPVDRKVSGYLVQAGELTLDREKQRVSVIDIIPSVTGLTQWEPTNPPGGRRFYKADPGITVNWSLTPNITLSAAVNPDFSQVETDVPLADVNQRFELFFPERRPFFLEGGEVFRPLQQSGASLNLVNTRRIIDPDFGVKLTGKIGRFNFGYLAAADRAPRFAAVAGSQAARQDAQFQIGRVQRDLGSDSAIGATFTQRTHAGSSNTVGASDYRIRLTPSVLFYGQHAVSRSVDNPNGFGLSGRRRSYVGYANIGRLTVERAKWFLRSSLRDISSDFEMDSGFLQRNGVTSTFHWMGYRIRPEKASRKFVELSPQLFLSGLRTRQGKIDETFADPTFFFSLARAIDVEVFYSFAREHFAGRNLPYRFFATNGSAAPYKLWSLQWEIALGGGAFYDPVNPQVGRNGIRTTGGLTLRPTSRLSAEIRHIHTSLQSRFSEQTLFNQNIWRERTVFQFNRFWSIRSITEFNASRLRIGVSELLTYLPSPNTAFYLGYNDLLSNTVGFGRLTSDPQDQLTGWNRQRQIFFFKLTYNWRM
jgi:hypothetical protein